MRLNNSLSREGRKRQILPVIEKHMPSSYQDYCEDYESVLHSLDDMDNPLRHEGRTSCYISAK